MVCARKREENFGGFAPLFFSVLREIAYVGTSPRASSKACWTRATPPSGYCNTAEKGGDYVLFVLKLILYNTEGDYTVYKGVSGEDLTVAGGVRLLWSLARRA